MRDAADVSVEHAIVHKIDHLNSDNTVLSEIALDLDANSKLRDYFGRQVGNALGDDNTRAAKFSDQEKDKNSAKEECFRILSNPDDLVAASQELAQRLRTAMAHDKRIALGSLAVCLYTAPNYPGLRFLALIKLDPSDALVQKIEKIKGKVVVTFDVQVNVMPTARVRLHKAALIAPTAMDPKYDLLLLDTQGAEAAVFFAKAFLNTVPAFDRRTTTRMVFDAINMARSIGNLSRDEAFAVQEFLPRAFEEESIKVSALVKRLPVADEKKRVFRDEIRKAVPDNVLQLDPTFARDKLLKKTRFRGAFGVRFEVWAQNFEDVVVNQQTKSAGVTRLTIDVQNLEWIK